MTQMKKYDELGDGQDWPPELMEIIWSKFPCSCAMCVKPIPEASRQKDRNGNPIKKAQQWHIQLKPVNREIGGSGAFHEWISDSNRKESLMGVWLKQLDELGIAVANYEDLEGKQLLIKKDNIEFERADGTSFIIENKRIPVGLPEGENQDSEPTATTDSESTNDFNDLDNILSSVGLTKAGIAKWTEKKGLTKDVVDEHMGQLKANGILEQGEDGLYTITEA